MDVLNTGLLERELAEAREGLSKMNDVFSRTQALLMVERRQSQQLALQVDLFQVCLGVVCCFFSCPAV